MTTVVNKDAVSVSYDQPEFREVHVPVYIHNELGSFPVPECQEEKYCTWIPNAGLVTFKVTKKDHT